MRIVVVTEVQGHFKRVFDRFNRELFEALVPPFVPLHIQVFEGALPGNVFTRGFGPHIMAIPWVSRILDRHVGESEAYFTDEGEVLPPPLSFVKHTYRVQAIGPAKSAIVEDFWYRTPHKVLDLLLYPVFFLSLKLRSSVYKKFFR